MPCDIAKIGSRTALREQGASKASRPPRASRRGIAGRTGRAHRRSPFRRPRRAHKRATLFGAQREGEPSPPRRAHEAIERKLPDEQAVLDARHDRLPRCGPKRNGDGRFASSRSFSGSSAQGLTTILSLGIWNPLDRRAARSAHAPLDRSVAHAHDREARLTPQPRRRRVSPRPRAASRRAPCIDRTLPTNPKRVDMVANECAVGPIN